MNKIPRWIARIDLAIAAVSLSAACLLANQQVTVTFSAEQQQVFRGFGFNRFNIPQQQRSAEEIADLTWLDMDFRVARVGVDYDITIDADYVASQNKRGIEIAKQRQPNLILLFNPTGKVVEPATWADYYVKIIHDLKHDHDLVFEYTGIKNEPNWGDEIAPEDIPEYVKLFRRTLDDYGLKDVKIIAPEASNVDTRFMEMLDYVISDPEALEALDCFAYHAYNMCMLDQVRALLRPYLEWGGGTKQLWETESSHAWYSEGFNDSAVGAETAAKILGDLNLGTNVWLYWLGFEQYDPKDNGARIGGFNPNTGAYRPFLKFFYFRQLSRTFEAGTIMRRGTTDMTRREDTFMEYTYGLKNPISAACGRTPEGDFVLAAANITGITPRGTGSSYYAADVYDITFVVEELADSGTKTFQVWRCNDGTRNVIDDRPAVMDNGHVTVSVRPCDLICLRDEFDTTFSEIRDPFYDDEVDCVGLCGLGAHLGLLPPLVFKGARAVRRRRRRKATGRKARISRVPGPKLPRQHTEVVSS